MRKTALISLTTLFVISSFAAITFTSCKKEKSCFSQALKDEYKDRFCTMDCPGVTGCDGKTYCNACMAAKEGITVVK